MKKTNPARSQPRSKALAELRAIYGPNYVVTIAKRRGRGRPKKIYVLRDEGLVRSLDWMIEEYRQKGLTQREARKRAFVDARAALMTEDSDGHSLPAGLRRQITAETLERYYRQGIRKLREGEILLAKEIDKIAAKRG
jgi:DNA-binding PadR family transcriptional regulator